MMIENEQNNNDVTKFLGIPVDGDPESMRQKLIAKGFKFIDGSDKFDPKIEGTLTGIFNNEQVYIFIEKNPHTGKVWRIIVRNQNSYSKDEAIIEFNYLLKQFNTKRNYTRTNEYLNTYYIPNDVNDVDFDKNVENNSYYEFYYQENSKMKSVWFGISKVNDAHKYDITIFYENPYNKPKDDEDL